MRDVLFCQKYTGIIGAKVLAMRLTDYSNPAIIASIKHWVADVVVRHRFCPFAKPAIDRAWVSYTVLESADATLVLEQLAERVSRLLEADNRDATELLIVANTAQTFDGFLDLTALAEALIESMGWDDQIQLATFHPSYCFANTSPGSIENYTNRAPWPVIQLLQVDSVGRAIDQVGDTETIPQRNIERLNAMDDATADQLMADSCPPPPSGEPRH